MRLKIELNDNSGILHMEGDLTVKQADDIKSALMRALDSVDMVIVDIKESSEIDLACLQLLCSVHRTATAMGKKIALSEHCPQPFKDISALAGFQRSTCYTDGCLWKSQQ